MSANNIAPLQMPGAEPSDIIQLAAVGSASEKLSTASALKQLSLGLGLAPKEDIDGDEEEKLSDPGPPLDPPPTGGSREGHAGGDTDTDTDTGTDSYENTDTDEEEYADRGVGAAVSAQAQQELEAFAAAERETLVPHAAALMAQYIGNLRSFNMKGAHDVQFELRTAVATYLNTLSISAGRGSGEEEKVTTFVPDSEEVGRLLRPIYTLMLEQTGNGKDSAKGGASPATGGSPWSPGGGTGGGGHRSPSMHGNSSKKESLLHDLRALQTNAWTAVKQMFPDKHPVIGVACASIARELQDSGRTVEALDYAGTALLISMQSHGLLSACTANRHHHLAQLYALLDQMVSAKKHAFLALETFRKLSTGQKSSSSSSSSSSGGGGGVRSDSSTTGPGDDIVPAPSAPTALDLSEHSCEFLLGCLEQATSRPEHAYAHYYNCYSKRLSSLGANHTDTQVALTAVRGARAVGAETYISVQELQSAIRALKWAKLPADTSCYRIAMLVNQLGAAAGTGGGGGALSHNRLRGLVSTALKLQSRSAMAAAGASARSPGGSSSSSAASASQVNKLATELLSACVQLPVAALAVPPSAAPIAGGAPGTPSSAISGSSSKVSTPGSASASAPSSALKGSGRSVAMTHALLAGSLISGQAPMSPAPAPALLSPPQAVSFASSASAADSIINSSTPGARGRGEDGSEAGAFAGIGGQTASSSNVPGAKASAAVASSPSAAVSDAATAFAAKKKNLPEPSEALARALAMGPVAGNTLTVNDLTPPKLTTSPSDDMNRGSERHANPRKSVRISAEVPDAKSEELHREHQERMNAQKDAKVHAELESAALSLQGTGVDGFEKDSLPFAMGKRLSVVARDQNNIVVVVTSLVQAAKAIKEGKMTFTLAAPGAAAAAAGSPGGASHASARPGIGASPNKESAASPTDSSSGSRRKSTTKKSTATAPGSAAEAAVREIPLPPPVPTSWPPVAHKPKVGTPNIADALAFKAGAPGIAVAGAPVGGPGGIGAAAAAAASGGGLKGAERAPPMGAFAAAKLAEKAKEKYKTIDLPEAKPISGSLQDTLWGAAMSDHVPLNVLFEDVEDEFLKVVKRKSDAALRIRRQSVKKALTVGKNGGSGAESKNSVFSESALDARRNQNLSIMLSQFGKKTSEAIANAIASFDSEFLGVSILQTLSENMPTPVEYKAVRAQFAKRAAVLVAAAAAAAAGGGGDSPPAKPKAPNPADPIDPEILKQVLSKASKAELYVYHLGALDNMAAKMHAMLGALSAAETGDACQKAATVMSHACAEVCDSDRLRYLMHLILQVGNAVNTRSTNMLYGDKKAAAAAGDAVGVKSFSLSALENLCKTKSNSGETVEEYLCYKLFLHLPQALDLAADLASIDGAKVVNMARLQCDVESIATNVAELEKLVAAEEKTLSSSKCTAAGDDATARKEKVELSVSNMKSRLGDAQKMSAKAALELKTAQQDYMRVCTYLCEDFASAAVTPQLVFSRLSKFVASINSATKNASEKVEKAKRMDRRAKERLNR